MDINQVQGLLARYGFSEREITRMMDAADFSRLEEALSRAAHLDTGVFSPEEINKMVRVLLPRPQRSKSQESSPQDKEKFLHDFGFSEPQIVKIQTAGGFSNSKDILESRLQVLVDYGLTRPQVCGIVASLPQFFGYSESSTESKLRNFEDYDFTKAEVVKIILRNPKILSYGTVSVNNSFDNLEDYGFTKAQIRAITIHAPTYLSNNDDLINKKLRNLEVYGFTRQEVVKAFSQSPSALTMAEDNVNSKLRNLESHSFTKQQVICLATKTRVVLTFSRRTVNSRIANLLKQRTNSGGRGVKFLKTELVDLVIAFPTILSYTTETIGLRMRIMAMVADYDKREMIAFGRNWVQSNAKTLARARAIKKHGESLRLNRNLFIGTKAFEKRYGVRC